MFEKYSLDAQKVLTFAESLAFSYADSEVNTLHLFVAFLKTNESELAMYLRSNSTKVLPFESLLKSSAHQSEHDEFNPFYLEYTEDVTKVMQRAEELSEEKKEKKVSSLSLSLALMTHEDDNLTKIYQMLKVEKDAVIKYLEKAYRKSSELDALIDLHRLGTKELDPLVGRTEELAELEKALRRRNKSNAILVGEPGVGKTHIVEHLAKLIEEGKIPSLSDKKVYELDIASTVSGTKYRGEFEEKIKKILKKVIDDGHTILFVDEVHNIVKAGGAEGAIDCANILKPYLTRGDISIIGATTLDEYEKVFSEDKALKRRFQVIKVRPNTKGETLEILKVIKPIYESFYDISISDNLLESVLNLTERYAPNEFYPDKAIDVLENASLESNKIMEMRDIVRSVEKLYKVKVDFKPKASSVISRIRHDIKGQERALKRLEINLELVDNSLHSHKRPLGVYMFIGPSGVGKTETAKSLAHHYFAEDLSFYKLDMAEFKDPSTITKLNGSSPGYIGYKDVSPLVRQLKTFPHSLILLDEIEKASVNVIDFFLNVFDEGYFTDNSGQRIDASNAFFIMTSNYSFDSEHLFKTRLTNTEERLTSKQIRKALEERFRYEFLARIDDIILFEPLSLEAKKGIVYQCLKDYRNSSDEELMEIAEEIIASSDHSEIERYGARALKRLAKEKLLSLSRQIKIEQL